MINKRTLTEQSQNVTGKKVRHGAHIVISAIYEVIHLSSKVPDQPGPHSETQVTKTTNKPIFPRLSGSMTQWSGQA